MEKLHELRCGWVSDIPDHRDLTSDQPRIVKILRRLPGSDGRRSLPRDVDLRDCCPPVVDQADLATSSAHAAVLMAQYFERRASGKLITPSRLFVHYNAQRISGSQQDARVSLRSAVKAMLRFGLPPERHWPYEPERVDRTPDGFVYGLSRMLRRCLYLRLDGRTQSGEETLDAVRSFLASGFACVCGFQLPSTVSDLPEIYFPVPRDDCNDGHAVLVVGYDNDRWIRSEKGAFLVQNSWGKQWGDAGYGWLPYAYVQDRLAVDFWTLVRRKWLRSGEFLSPLS
jgi:C1A family cysteine protease